MSHDGSLGLAHAFIDAIADAGADAVKFQTHIAAAESTPAEPFRVKFSRQDASRYDYWKRMEFSEDEWRGLATHCEERNVLFISSPFSLEAVDLLQRVGQPLWKIASGEVSNVPLLDRVLDTGSPVLLSTGMSPLAETDAAVARVKARGATVGVLQCTTAYPCPPERVGLNLIPVYRERYGCWVGLSDHSGTIYPGLAGATLGLDVLEVHVALSREMFGPDVVASVTTAELRQLVDGVRFIERMRGNPLDKDASAREHRSAAASVHAQRRGAARARRAAPCSGPTISRSRSRAPACRRSASPSSSAGSSVRRWRKTSCWPSTTSKVCSDASLHLLCRRTVTRRANCSAQTKNLRRRHRAAELLAHPYRPARHPGASGPRAAARRGRVGAARSLRQRHSGHRARRVSASPRASTWWSRARTSSPRPSPPASGSWSWRRSSTTSSRTRWSRSPIATRRSPPRSRPSYMNIPRRARAGRRGHRLDRREGPARGHQAVEPAPGLDEGRGRARQAAGRGARDGGHHRMSVDRHRRRGRGRPGARLRSVREVRRRRPDARICRGAISS